MNIRASRIALFSRHGAGARRADPKDQARVQAGRWRAMAMPVVAVAAERQPVVESVSLVGTLAANEEVEVKAETDGIVQEVRFQEGQVIERGGLLVTLDDTKLRAELADAEARLKLSRRVLRA
jgi:multidrug efflux pump subunit AcrA (membrane-fusion protein)